MPDVQLVSIVDVIRGFPRCAEPEVARDNLLEFLRSLFDGGSRIVVAEGTAGSGLTTLLSQFVRRYPKNTIGLFLNSSSPHGYSLDYIRLQIYEQIFWHLEARLPDPDEIVDDALLNGSLRRFQRLSRHEPACFVVDGLEDVRGESPSAFSQIIKVALPFSFPEFRFLLAGAANVICNTQTLKPPPKQFPLSPFTTHETKDYLSGLVTDPVDLERVNRVTQGHPGKLASIRRALIDGRSLESLLAGRKEELADFIQEECHGLSEAPQTTRIAIALAVFAKRPIYLSEVALLVSVSETELQESLSKLPFVLAVAGQPILFKTEGHYRYLQSALESEKAAATRILIEQLALRPLSENEIAVAPTYFEELGKESEFLAFLNPERVEFAIRQFSSHSSLAELVQKALEAAKKLGPFRRSFDSA